MLIFSRVQTALGLMPTAVLGAAMGTVTYAGYSALDGSRASMYAALWPADLQPRASSPATPCIQPATMCHQPATACIQPATACIQPATLCTPRYVFFVLAGVGTVGSTFTGAPATLRMRVRRTCHASQAHAMHV